MSKKGNVAVVVIVVVVVVAILRYLGLCREATILVKILGTSHKIALLQSLIQCPPLPPFQCWLNQTPFDHPNIELGGEGDEKVLNVCFHLDILGNITKTQKFASVPIYFDQDCRLISPFTQYRFGFMPLLERFHLRTRKRYEAYRIGAFSCKQEANSIRNGSGLV